MLVRCLARARGIRTVRKVAYQEGFDRVSTSETRCEELEDVVFVSVPMLISRCPVYFCDHHPELCFILSQDLVVNSSVCCNGRFGRFTGSAGLPNF